MPQRAARGPYAKTAARRAEILQVARDSFAELGYENASLRLIAERAGLTHVGLLHHFASKEALLQALLALRDDEELRRSVAVEPNTFLIDALLTEHQKTPELMRLWGELTAAAARVDHPAHEYFVTRYETARTHFVAWLTGAQERGELRAGNEPQSTATLFIAVLDGLQTQWLLDPTLDIIEPVRRFRNLVLTS